VRKTIERHADIEAAFDRATYAKGSSLLHMFETWLGEAALRAGLRHYIAQHRYGSVTTEDLGSALEEAVGVEVQAALRSFVDRVGTPSVRFDGVCPASGPTQVLLAQGRESSSASGLERSEPWIVPGCVRYPSGSGVQQACTLLREPEGILELQGADRCPAWIHPNAGGVGY